jgi:ABC-type branched-subunit amino acid transport system ATPase component
MNTVTIDNLKGISHLEFQLPAQPGVYLLVGSNGVGKTTLLTCLRRICDQNAFRNGFPAAAIEGVDEFERTAIRYQSEDLFVTFHKRQKRWSPTPKQNVNLVFDSMGYSNVVYIGADEKRIGITKEEILTGKRVAVPEELKDEMNIAFETDRFDGLTRVENKNGRRWFQYFYIIKDPRTGETYSEKRFSAGELALLQVFGSLSQVEDNCLALIDEGELALYPKAQEKLFKRLMDLSASKRLTILVSTHSNTLVSMAKPDHILLLERTKNGAVELVTPCYPARAMQSLDALANIIDDYVILVEDEMARLCFKAMRKHLGEIQPEARVAGMDASACVIPVGTYLATAQLAASLPQQLSLSSRVKVRAILDHDAFDNENPELDKLRNKNNNLIIDLGFTPEVALVEKLESNDFTLLADIKREFKCDMQSILDSDGYRDASKSPKERKRAKSQFDYIVKQLTSKSGDSEEVVEYKLIEMLVARFDQGMMKRVIGLAFS